MIHNDNGIGRPSKKLLKPLFHLMHVHSPILCISLAKIFFFGFMDGSDFMLDNGSILTLGDGSVFMLDRKSVV